MTTHMTERAAILPPRAASALLATPVTSKVTTRGMTVILRPSSHKVPMNEARDKAVSCESAGHESANQPRTSPKASPASVQHPLKLFAALSVGAAVVSLNAASGT
jgi:hypothetical protein